jgi:hypothetical protein
MTLNQQHMLGVLKARHAQAPGAYTGPTVLAEKANWTGPYNDGLSSKASPILKQLVELGLAERNDRGQYRLKV